MFDGEPRIVTVINASRKSFQGSDYGCWVGGGSFEQVGGGSWKMLRAVEQVVMVVSFAVPGMLQGRMESK